MEFKAIETVYNGYRFRSRLEARWAVFFNAAGIKYEYEPEGFDLGGGLYYLPDFRIWVNCRNYPGEPTYRPIYVEVKGYMDDESKNKIEKFGQELIVLTNIPADHKEYFDQYCLYRKNVDGFCGYNNFRYIDGDEYCAFFTLDNGNVWIAGSDHDQWDGGKLMDDCLLKSRQARFEHGERG